VGPRHLRRHTIQFSRIEPKTEAARPWFCRGRLVFATDFARLASRGHADDASRCRRAFRTKGGDLRASLPICQPPFVSPELFSSVTRRRSSRRPFSLLSLIPSPKSAALVLGSAEHSRGGSDVNNAFVGSCAAPVCRVSSATCAQTNFGPKRACTACAERSPVRREGKRARRGRSE